MVKQIQIEAATGGPAPGLPINFLLCSSSYREGLRKDTAARRQFLCDSGFFAPDYQIPNIPTRVVPKHIAEAAEKAGVKVTWNQLVEDVRQFRSAFLFLGASEAMIKEGLVNNSHHLAVKNLAKDKIKTWQQAAVAYAKYQRELEQAAELARSTAATSEPADRQVQPVPTQLPTVAERVTEIASRIVVPEGATYRDALTQATSGLIEQLAVAEDRLAQASQGSSGEVLKHLQQERTEEVASFGRRLQTMREELTGETERADRLAGQLREYLKKETEYEKALGNLEQAQKDLTARGIEIGSLRESLQLVREENNVLMNEWAQALEDLDAAKLALAAAKTSLDADVNKALEEIVALCPDKTKARALVTQLYAELAKVGDEQPATPKSGANGTYSKNNWPVTCTADGRAIKIPNALRAEIGRLPKKHQLVIFRNLGTIVDHGFNFEGLNHVPLRTSGANQKCVRMGSFLLEYTVESNALHFTKLWSNADFQKRR